MRTVKASGNKSTELKLIEHFRQAGIIGWRRNYKLVGKPDFVFPQKRLAVFVDGCFWHGHNCRQLKPSSNSDYWRSKIGKNKKRDRLITKELKSKGWQVLRIWECQLTRNFSFPKELTLNN